MRLLCLFAASVALLSEAFSPSYRSRSIRHSVAVAAAGASGKRPPPPVISEKKGSVGGVYEFRGSIEGGPPPELASLLGLQSGRPVSSTSAVSKPAPTRLRTSAALTATTATTKPVSANANAKPRMSEKDMRKEKASRKAAAVGGRGASAGGGGGGEEDAISLEKLELQLLAKYGSKVYREVLEEGWEDDEDDEEEVTKRREPAVPGSIKLNKRGKFAGFNPPATPSEQSEDDSAKEKMRKEETERKFYKGLKTLSYKEEDNLDEDEVEDEEEEEEDEKAVPLVAAAAATTLKKRAPLLLGSKIIARETAIAKKVATPSVKKASDDVSLEDIFNDDYEGAEGEQQGDDEEEENIGEWRGGGEVVGGKRWERVEGALRSTFVPKAEEPRSGPLNAVAGFRLRKPLPVSAEEQAKLDAKAAALLAKEEAQKEKRKAKKALEATTFFPFDFSTAEEVGEGDKIFTTKTFSDIGVSNPVVLANLDAMNLIHPTKIQELAVPAMMGGKDVVLQAQTGSGKTISFLLPLLNVVDPNKKKVQVIILAPSRELVTQIGLVGELLFQNTGINILSIIGGANVKNQIKRLRDERPQIVVASPGRLAELVFRLRKLRLGMVRAVIIDEVDNMLQEPYIGELQTILEATPLFGRSSSFSSTSSPTYPSPLASSTSSASSDDLEELMLQEDGSHFSTIQKDMVLSDVQLSDLDDLEDEEDDDDEEEEQGGDSGPGSDSHLIKRLVCLASATGNVAAVKQFADRFCAPGWVKASVDASSQLPAGITHGLISTPRMRALDQLKKFLKSEPAVKSALIFVNDPHRVEVICEQLQEVGMIAAPLHGDSSKDDRKEVIARIRDGRLNLVVTTELAARGLDIPNLTHVVNFELPTDAQHYVHRAGRCGRAGRRGLVMNFANPDTKFVIRRFGKQLGVKVLDAEIRDGRVHLKSK